MLLMSKVAWEATLVKTESNVVVYTERKMPYRYGTHPDIIHLRGTAISIRHFYSWQVNWLPIHLVYDFLCLTSFS